MQRRSKKIDPPVEIPVQIPSIALLTAASEANHGADREARAIRGAARIVEADVVELRAQREMGKYAEIHATADAIREVGIGGPAVAES